MRYRMTVIFKPDAKCKMSLKFDKATADKSCSMEQIHLGKTL